MSSNSQEILFQIISDQLRIKADTLKLSHHFINDLKADSLDIVELIMSVEEQWNISIPDTLSEKMETLQDLLNYIKTNT